MSRPADSNSLMAAWDNLRSDYSAAKNSRYRRRRTGLATGGGGADFHYRSEADYLRVLEEARDMDRNDSIIGQMVDRAKENVVQEGFKLEVHTGDPKLDRDIWDRFDAWASDPLQCDAAGEMNFVDLQEHTCRAPMIDGDIFALPLDEGQLQMTEAHRCRTPSGTKRNVVHGVLLDEQRRRQQYWFTKDDIDPSRALTKVGDIEAYPAFEYDDLTKRMEPTVFHVHDPKRVSQTRGITPLAPVFDDCGMFEDINFAKLVQQQTVSAWAILRTRSMGFKATGNAAGQTGSRFTTTHGDGTSKIVQGVAPGMEVAGLPGETISGFSSNVPNAEYFPHVKLMLTLIGINLGVPLVMMLMDASETNFSGWRGAIDQARRGFRRRQRWLADKFHKKVYRWKVRQFMAEDAALRSSFARLGDKLFAHAWNFPRWPYVQPLQDAQADALRIEKGLASPRAIAAENGGDEDDVREETIADNKARILAALKARDEIQALHPKDQIDWHELLYVPTANSVAVALKAQQAAIAENKQEEANAA